MLFRQGLALFTIGLLVQEKMIVEGTDQTLNWLATLFIWSIAVTEGLIVEEDDFRSKKN